MHNAYRNAHAERQAGKVMAITAYLFQHATTSFFVTFIPSLRPFLLPRCYLLQHESFAPLLNPLALADAGTYRFGGTRLLCVLLYSHQIACRRTKKKDFPRAIPACDLVPRPQESKHRAAEERSQAGRMRNFNSRCDSRIFIAPIEFYDL